MCSAEIQEGSEEVNAIPNDIDEDDKYLLLVSGDSKYLPPLTSSSHSIPLISCHLLSSLFSDFISSRLISSHLISSLLFSSCGLHYIYNHFVFCTSSHLILIILHHYLDFIFMQLLVFSPCISSFSIILSIHFLLPVLFQFFRPSYWAGRTWNQITSKFHRQW